MPHSAARSPGWVTCAMSMPSWPATMSVLTKPGQSAVERMPCSQPARRTAWLSATTACLAIW